VISILGNNPAQITVGTNYADLGATVVDTNADGTTNNNLGLHFTVDGKPVTDITLDTSVGTNTYATTTHTVVYSAVDGEGNWSYATRTVQVINGNSTLVETSGAGGFSSGSAADGGNSSGAPDASTNSAPLGIIDPMGQISPIDLTQASTTTTTTSGDTTASTTAAITDTTASNI
jgi:hypothetical protein